MNKKQILEIVLLSAIVILTVILYVYSTNQTKELSDNKIKEIVSPILEKYCQNLEFQVQENKPKYGSFVCPSCRYNEDQIKIIKEGTSKDKNSNWVEQKEDSLILFIPTSYGRNDQPGEINLTINLDSNQRVIQENYSTDYCII